MKTKKKEESFQGPFEKLTVVLALFRILFLPTLEWNEVRMGEKREMIPQKPTSCNRGIGKVLL